VGGGWEHRKGFGGVGMGEYGDGRVEMVTKTVNAMREQLTVGGGGGGGGMLWNSVSTLLIHLEAIALW
jgi:hypothetical protein